MYILLLCISLARGTWNPMPQFQLPDPPTDNPNGGSKDKKHTKRKTRKTYRKKSRKKSRKLSKKKYNKLSKKRYKKSK